MNYHNSYYSDSCSANTNSHPDSYAYTDSTDFFCPRWSKWLMGFEV
jgi:hypothetical protein